MDIVSAHRYLQESLKELRAHHHSLESRPLKAELRHVRTGPGSVHFQIWWTGVSSRVANDLVWDAFDVEIGHAENLNKFTSRVDTAELRVTGGDVLPGFHKPVPDVPLFRYQPQRFRAFVPFAKNLVHLAENSGDTMFTADTINAVAQEYIQNQRDPGALMIRPRITNRNKRELRDITELGLFFCEFNRTGRQIFDFPHTLIEMFRHTDVADIPLDALQFPYPCFYLYFGPQTDLETKPGWHPDGAYVSVLGETKHIQMLLTSAPPDVATYARWLSHHEPIYAQAMSPEMTKIGVGEATEMVLAEKINELRKQINGPGLPIEAAVDDLRAEGVDVPDGMKIGDASQRNARAELEALPAKQAAWREMLNLVVNALAYLSAYPEDIDQRWPDNTPRSLYLQSQDGTPKQKRRARSKLSSLGYTSVHMCGRRIRQNASLPSDPANETSTRKPTWVRGHWVRQPYGPKHSLRRLQWRMPHLRNATETPSPEETGHIYAVS